MTAGNSPDFLAHARGFAFLERRAYGDAVVELRRSVALAPDDAAAAGNLGKALYQLGHVDAAIAWLRRAMAIGDRAVAQQASLSIACIIASSATDPAGVRQARQNWADRLAIAPPAPPPAVHREQLRVGYLSRHFADANWMKPVWGVINHHDRDAFAVHLFSDGADPSEASGYRDHDADTIHDIGGVACDRLAAIIRTLGIDVLVDLNAYSFPERLPLLLYRPAPVAVGWFNHFGPSGIAALDWLVGDAQVIRPGDHALFGERLHCVAGSYLAFQVLHPAPDAAPPPLLQRGHLTFGCLGAHYKLTDEVLQTWAQILYAAPTAALFVKNAALSDGSVRADLMGRLRRLGVAESRVILEGGAAHKAFLDAYKNVDIALDTFPYNGGTTTTEALWQGVPVLTFEGAAWAGRTSASLLHAAGLAEWIQPDRAAYTARAVMMACKPEVAGLQALRAAMRARLSASAACDSESLCRQLETFYRAAFSNAAWADGAARSATTP